VRALVFKARTARPTYFINSEPYIDGRLLRNCQLILNFQTEN